MTDLAVSALARALVRTGMYVDAGIDTSAGLDKPQVYAAAILNDPDMAADGLYFVMIETLERAALAATGDSEGPLDVEMVAEVNKREFGIPLNSTRRVLAARLSSEEAGEQ